MKNVVERDSLGLGKHRVAFEGVVREVSGAFGRPTDCWAFANEDGVARIVTGTRVSPNNAAGRLLAVLQGSPVVVNSHFDTDVFLGKEFLADIRQEGERRVTTISALDGGHVAVSDDGE